ncbi:alpha/beta-hydrolase [Aspergillus ibericus CBS 121593]|uniref:Alpha/beta-hydrolase n=1 Tax=Aspergillus ibericus CBS 121593 TaxID=1448316 RepID=A0A395GPL4_9EURO|nr:alpha/beta-hydrolase [Aspergillus ibericus CBS 121593]RAK95983.1 alpha/beta-hydrolase [Aspergillus ibericus CBS 121593]
MSPANFSVTDHIIPACYVREYAGSTVDQEDQLHLHVKQYTPRDLPDPVPAGAVTIIATHAVGFPKELYEPLWDELLTRSKQSNFHIRGIWIADVANMGMSSVLNEDKLSMDSSWMDHPRDLLLMINHFRDQMPRPLVGIGHSFGGTILTNLALMHPRLLTSLILMDPVIQLTAPPMGFNSDPTGPVNWCLYREDIWPNRASADAAHRKASKRWDPRCLDLMAEFGFRDLPTALHPDLPDTANPSDPPVTLTTTKYHEVLGQLRENFNARTPDGRIQIDRSTHADADPLLASLPVYKPEPSSTWHKLPFLRPSTLFLLGEYTYLRLDQLREGAKRCGQGVGGSGGNDKVKEITIPKRGHFFPFESVVETAGYCAGWLDEVVGQYGEAERVWSEKRKQMTKRDHLVLSDEWRRVLKPPARPVRKNKL